MRKIIEAVLAATFRGAPVLRRRVLAAAGACFCLALILAARAESSTNQAPAAESRPGGATNVVAAYDEGSITAGDVAEYIDEPHFLADADQNAPPNAAIGQEEKIARHLAALRILVNEARRRGLDRPVDPEVAKLGRQLQHQPFNQNGAGWRLEAKLIEQTVLAEALTDETRRSVMVSDEEVNEQYRTNRFKLLGFQTVEAGRIGISAKQHGTNSLERAKAALALIRGGQDFATVARQYSDLDPKLAQKSIYSADFWGTPNGIALAELGEGKVSDPLPVPDGFELVKVERIYLKDNPGPEEAKAKLRVMLNVLALEDRSAEMLKSAEIAFPIFVAPTNPSPTTPDHQLSTPQPSTNQVLLQCGQLTLTREDVRGLAIQRGVPQVDDQQMIENIKQENGDHLQMGELARGLGFDKRPDVRKAIRYELDKKLAEKARLVLEPEMRAAVTFDERRIRKAYDETFKATFEPQLQYDLLLVPMGVPANATAEARETARTNAQAKAQALIRRIQDGASFDALAGGEAGAQLMSGQSRTVREGSPLYPLVSTLKAGEVAAEPYEDFGGFCIVRVNKYEERRKMPYELAKNYIIEDFRTEGLDDLRKNFESVLLDKHHFVFGPAAAARARDTASAPKTNNQQ